MVDKIQQILDTANQQLKSANTGITIFKRGSKLSLRGMLPPKPGSNRQQPSQQTISLGMYANPAGIKIAKLEAQKLGAAIALGEFDWSDYLETNTVIDSVEYWIAKFEENYFNRKDRNKKTETTWKDYQKIFKKFPDGASLTAESLMAVVLSTAPDTRTRQKACTYTKALALFAGINFEPSNYGGNYSPESVELRDIPTDKAIMEWRNCIPDRRGWQYAFGLMAAYGLRSHELFYADLDSIKKSPAHLRIVESKRGKKRERLMALLN
ncbi:MAG: integrase [Waterburya sp.]